MDDRKTELSQQFDELPNESLVLLDLVMREVKAVQRHWLSTVITTLLGVATGAVVISTALIPDLSLWVLVPIAVGFAGSVVLYMTHKLYRDLELRTHERIDVMVKILETPSELSDVEAVRLRQRLWAELGQQRRSPR